ncbi:hypothetical protein Acr_00g0074300 [Actinidia rufa]|uniref:Uncharacterized protein n=1 Tax=Actinidia rufa TaxID=165716 RepID=A0A7J0DSC7_9ERIC|nr:hypothetical protein Acr_00g0074300 [Actinidia rufa]
MELNRAQLLVHDDAALNKFRTDHGIPNDVQIDRSRPNEDANLVEGHGNKILVRICLIQQAGLWFPISRMLKKVMARCRLTFMKITSLSITALSRIEVSNLVESGSLHYEFRGKLFRVVGVDEIKHAFIEGSVLNQSSEDVERLQSPGYSIKRRPRLGMLAIRLLLRKKIRSLLLGHKGIRFKFQKIACGPVYERVFNLGINRAGDNYDKQVAELCLSIYLEGWLACLTKLSIPVDHLTWTKAAPEFELMNSLESYSPLILLGFNEEEYMNHPAKKGGDKDP